MIVFIVTLLAMLLDPLVLLVCWVFSAMIGVYRISIPVTAFVSVCIFWSMSAHPINAVTLIMFALVGAIHGAIALALWRLIRRRFGKT